MLVYPIIGVIVWQCSTSKRPTGRINGGGAGDGARLGLLPVPNWYQLQISQEALSFSAVRASFQPSRYVSATLCKSLCFHIKTRLHKLTTHSWLCNDSIPSGRTSLSRDLPCRQLSFVFIKCCLSKNHYLYLQQSISDNNGSKGSTLSALTGKNTFRFSLTAESLVLDNKNSCIQMGNNTGLHAVSAVTPSHCCVISTYQRDHLTCNKLQIARAGHNTLGFSTIVKIWFNSLSV